MRYLKNICLVAAAIALSGLRLNAAEPDSNHLTDFQSERDTLSNYYGYGQTSIEELLRVDESAYLAFENELVTAYKEGNLERLVIEAWGCPVGRYPNILRVPQKRAENFRNYILSRTEIPDSLIVIGKTGIAWDILADCIENDPDVPGREQALDILRNTPEFNASGSLAGGKRQKFLNNAGGRTWKYVRDRYFPKMRLVNGIIELSHATMSHSFSVDGQATEVTVTPAARKLEPLPELAAIPVSVAKPAKGLAPETIAEPVWEPEPERFMWEGSKVWVKTNAVFWGLLITNAAVEFRLADQWSFDIPVFYSPYTVAQSFRFRTFAMQPSARYWLKPGFKGHFFGVHVTGGMFNVSVDNKNRYQDTHGMWGAGLDYGYAFKFSEHWGLELNLGAGYLWSRYDTYYNIKNGIAHSNDVFNYFGITRAGISAIYKF